MMGTTGTTGTPELNVVTLQIGRRLVAEWRDKGLGLSLGDDDKIVPSRRLTAAEMAQMREIVVSTDEQKVTARDAIFEALRQEWLATVAQPLSETCAVHPDRDVYRYSNTGVAECEECALFGQEPVQAVLLSLPTAATAEAATAPLTRSQRHYLEGA